MNFGAYIVWILVEVLLCTGLGLSVWTVNIGVAAPMTSLGFSLMLLVYPLMTKHFGFISHHLTEKEFHARLKTIQKLHVADEKILSVNFAQKVSNLYRFFFRRNPPSQI